MIVLLCLSGSSRYATGRACSRRGCGLIWWPAAWLLPLMLAVRRGLIINTVAWDRGLYLGNLFYDVAKAAIVRMSWGMAKELRPYGVVAVALAPGFVRTERVMAAHAMQPFPLDRTESPEYIGRAVAFLAADPRMMEKSGKILAVGDLAQEYGFADVDGKQPPAFRIDE